jgi:hypothetical protein
MTDLCCEHQPGQSLLNGLRSDGSDSEGRQETDHQRLDNSSDFTKGSHIYGGDIILIKVRWKEGGVDGHYHEQVYRLGG